MELKNNHKNFLLLPIVTNGIFAETLDLLCGKCFNLSKSVSARSSSYHFGMNLCVCMRGLV